MSLECLSVLYMIPSKSRFFRKKLSQGKQKGCFFKKQKVFSLENPEKNIFRNNFY